MAKRVDLTAVVNEALKIDQLIKRKETRLTELKDAIKAEFVSREIMEFSTADGVANLTLATSKSYDVDKLRELLTDAEFEQLCPPTPDGKKIAATVELNPPFHLALVKSKALVEKTTQRLSLKPK